MPQPCGLKVYSIIARDRGAASCWTGTCKHGHVTIPSLTGVLQPPSEPLSEANPYLASLGMYQEVQNLALSYLTSVAT